MSLADLDNLTVKELKEYAVANNIKYPSTTKKIAVEYIKGCVLENKLYLDTTKDTKQYIKIIENVSSLNPVSVKYEKEPHKDDPTCPNWIRHLYEHGWTTVKIEGLDPCKYESNFWDWLEAGNHDLKRNDAKTWKSNMPENNYGVILNYLNHEKFQWEIRELCHKYFAELWKNQNLLCSFDGGCFFPPQDSSPVFKSWWHADQGRYSTERVSIQGIVCLTSCEKLEDGGLVLVEDSFKIFEEYLNRHPKQGIVGFAVQRDDPLIKNKRNIKICAPAGSLILFDSRMFHCNVQPWGKQHRMCIYVSMMPSKNCSDKTRKKRVEAYNKGLTTNHYCYGPWMKIHALHPHTYGRESKFKPVINIHKDLTNLQKQMIGL